MINNSHHHLRRKLLTREPRLGGRAGLSPSPCEERDSVAAKDFSFITEVVSLVTARKLVDDRQRLSALV